MPERPGLHLREPSNARRSRVHAFLAGHLIEHTAFPFCRVEDLPLWARVYVAYCRRVAGGRGR